jgi:5-methylcytosine-specific restriction endonuclease McrA
MRRYRAAHKKQRAEYNRLYGEAHREERTEFMRRWRAGHRSRYLASARTHVANRRARMRGSDGTHTAADIIAQQERQKGRCYWCKRKLKTETHVDHVIPLVLGGSNGPENIVISCPRCNLAKGAKHPADFAGVMC